MSESIFGSKVPGLENVSRQKGTAVDVAIGAAEYWYQKARAAQLIALGTGFALGAAVALFAAYLRYM